VYAQIRHGTFWTVFSCACDLVVRAGTQVLAVADGTIIQGPYRLVRYTSEEPKCDAWTYAIEVQHGNP
jgi:hypothetical protein